MPGAGFVVHSPSSCDGMSVSSVKVSFMQSLRSSHGKVEVVLVTFVIRFWPADEAISIEVSL